MHSQGNSSASTLPREISSSVFSSRMHRRSSHAQESQALDLESRPPSIRSSVDPAASLTALLNAAPVDLCRISDEVRAHPDLKALLLRLASCLSFSPDASTMSIEDAVVVAGTDRLRVLVYLWSVLREKNRSQRVRRPARSENTLRQPQRMPRPSTPIETEVAHLASLLRISGFDSGAAPNRTFSSSGREFDLFDAPDIWIRDILSLFPLAQPAPSQQNTTVLTGPNGFVEGESE